MRHWQPGVALPSCPVPPHRSCTHLKQVTRPRGPLACMHSGAKPPDPTAMKLCQVSGFCLPKKPSPTPFWL